MQQIEAAPTATASLNLSELELTEEKGDTRGQAGGTDSSEGAGVGSKDRVVVVGSGPAGLFAALSLAEAGVPVTLLERYLTVFYPFGVSVLFDVIASIMLFARCC